MYFSLVKFTTMETRNMKMYFSEKNTKLMSGDCRVGVWGWQFTLSCCFEPPVHFWFRNLGVGENPELSSRISNSLLHLENAKKHSSCYIPKNTTAFWTSSLVYFLQFQPRTVIVRVL